MKENSGQFKKGHIPWTQGIKGIIPWNKSKKGVQIAWNKGMKLNDEQKKKLNLKGLELGHQLNEKHFNWKGDKASYRALHIWVERRLGKPMCCDNCGTTEGRRFHWANKDGKYRRIITDWVRLCPKYHGEYDSKRRHIC